MNLAASGVLFPTSIMRQVGAARAKSPLVRGGLCLHRLWGRQSLLAWLEFPCRDTGSPVQFRSLLTNHFFSVRCVPSMACL